ncbi:enoyl-CoA hydratase-related protein [Peredibacter starrii]|uniref:Enoyl-CoA hydratase-related protein n=1 Tax=Peredibacter starrii TaxID=28202 RepID=A0AAX4HSV2_9BACT|nr:enoyl-CoA hydratase-related protein [Peredibacter starrii]WPU66297.1 enoyl-CoA hydratase-related protein [Peredibacter starrii]
MKTFETIKYEVNNGTAIITINRPQVYNALNVQGKLDIISGIKEANKDTTVRSIILTAEGKAFCSGQDLNDRTVDASKGPVDIGHTIETEWNPLIEAIRTSDKLVIGAIQGVCAGAGLSVALACDMKIAAPGVRFISGFSQIGLAPDAGMSFMLVRQMGITRALEFALLGKPLLSEAMLEYNFINSIAENPLQDAVKLATEINNLAPLSVKMVKKNLQYANEKELGDVLNREKYVQRMLGFSQDYKEGVAAFLEKRKPQFKGQ